MLNITTTIVKFAIQKQMQVYRNIPAGTETTNRFENLLVQCETVALGYKLHVCPIEVVPILPSNWQAPNASNDLIHGKIMSFGLSVCSNVSPLGYQILGDNNRNCSDDLIIETKVVQSEDYLKSMERTLLLHLHVVPYRIEQSPVPSSIVYPY